ncbi:phosphotransferase [Tropicimonas sp. TH_r6]|uniref:phosphotransferase family protein n=1 Tax=Tropicimonas sp. TH_r6 TaxID=3082085 RepID=UPI0029547888|nr:phosphotransferase [Tropicimonas sp. TH_r6]MDV7143195.1 phosphotransferase [Tropicimonas sp. TH_r6]
MLPSAVEREVLAHWPGLLARAGLPEEGWRLTSLAVRDDPAISRASLLGEHPTAGHYTCKVQLRPEMRDAFAAQFARQAEIWDVFPHSERLTLPRPVALHPTAQASLITYIDGRPLSEAMRAADRKTQLQLLAHAGEWLDAYHRCGIKERRLFQPGYTLRHYEGLRAEIRAGSFDPAARGLFLRGIDRLAEIAPEHDRRETVSAVQHGDFHMRNLVFDGTRLAGIDISKTAPAPVGHDIAKILFDFATVLRSAEALPPGEILPEDVRAAFFHGYRLVGPDDPSVGFLIYARILATLQHVPRDRADRSDAKQRTLQRLRPFAKRAFG